MSNIRFRFFVGLLAVGLLFAPAVRAGTASSVSVADAWARASPGAAGTGAAYASLMSRGQPDSLVGASTPVAATAEVHETIEENGVMKMRSVQAVPLPADQMVTLKPGGLHIMLTGLKQKLVAGQSFPLTLQFAHAAPVTVEVKIQGVGQPPAGGHDQMHM